MSFQQPKASPQQHEASIGLKPSIASDGQHASSRSGQGSTAPSLFKQQAGPSSSSEHCDNPFEASSDGEDFFSDFPIPAFVAPSASPSSPIAFNPINDSEAINCDYEENPPASSPTPTLTSALHSSTDKDTTSHKICCPKKRKHNYPNNRKKPSPSTSSASSDSEQSNTVPHAEAVTRKDGDRGWQKCKDYECCKKRCLIDHVDIDSIVLLRYKRFYCNGEQVKSRVVMDGRIAEARLRRDPIKNDWNFQLPSRADPNVSVPVCTRAWGKAEGMSHGTLEKVLRTARTADAVPFDQRSNYR